jgi:hypothetical protein
MLSVCVGYAGSVTATVDTQEIVRGNMVTLSIKASGGTAVFPNIQTIGKEKVERTSTSSSRNVSMINGTIKNETSTTKVLDFTPTENMIIPSYKVEIDGKVYTSKPIPITVVKSSAPANKGNQMFTLTLKSEKSKVRVGESFMVTAYFALRKDIKISQNIQYTPPNLSDFSVIELPQPSAYIKGKYQIQEVRYILTAISEGNVSLSKAQIKVGVRSDNARGFFSTFATKMYKTQSNSLNISVLPQLQASDIVGEFTLTNTLDKTATTANKPVNLTLKIEGKGNLQGFELPAYAIDGVTVYSDQAKIDTKVVNGEIYSIFTQSFAFISSSSFTIPEREITNYNPKKESLNTLKIKSVFIDVNNTKGILQPQVFQKIKEPLVVEKRIEVQYIAWWMILLAFVLGMLVMYLGRFIPPLSKKTSTNEKEALKLLYGHINEDKAIEEMVRKLYAKSKGDKSILIDKKVLKEMLAYVEPK